jgi:hypothetical protein
MERDRILTGGRVRFDKRGAKAFGSAIDRRMES